MISQEALNLQADPAVVQFLEKILANEKELQDLSSNSEPDTEEVIENTLAIELATLALKYFNAIGLQYTHKYEYDLIYLITRNNTYIRNSKLKKEILRIKKLRYQSHFKKGHKYHFDYAVGCMLRCVFDVFLYEKPEDFKFYKSGDLGEYLTYPIDEKTIPEICKKYNSEKNGKDVGEKISSGTIFKRSDTGL